MVREIGSEFWSEAFSGEAFSVLEKYKGEQRYYMSGRTALYEILSDIKKNKKCEIAYLPAYCCDSMVLPFLAHDIKVVYYEIVIEDGFKALIDPEFKCDILFTVDYFGYKNISESVPNAVHIHDVTHSFLTEPTYKEVDYYFGSLRKWGPIAGAGMACKVKGNFQTEMSKVINDSYYDLRNKGYDLKNRFMHKAENTKEEFLKLFAAAEELLDEDYQGYAADKKSMDVVNYIYSYKNQRRKNAARLINGLTSSRLIELVYPVLGAEDVPLFVPIIVKKGMRNELRKFLIENQVYCPVHWPKHNGMVDDIYDNELSLICDQRYSEEDMDRIIELVKAFEKGNE